MSSADQNTYMNAAVYVPDTVSKTTETPTTVPKTNEPQPEYVYCNPEDPPIRNTNSVGKISIAMLANDVTLKSVNSYKDLRKGFQVSRKYILMLNITLNDTFYYLYILSD